MRFEKYDGDRGLCMGQNTPYLFCRPILHSFVSLLAEIDRVRVDLGL